MWIAMLGVVVVLLALVMVKWAVKAKKVAIGEKIESVSQLEEAREDLEGIDLNQFDRMLTELQGAAKF